MVVAVAPENAPTLQKLCDTFDTELTDIGTFTGMGRLVVRYDKTAVVDMDNEFLHEGIPQRQLKAVISEQVDKETGTQGNMKDLSTCVRDYLLTMLSSPNVASKASVIRIYDHEVQGGTVVKPLTGVEADAPSDATVIKPIGTKGRKGIVLSNGINPEYGKHNAYKMAWSVMDEAIRNAVAVGADPDRIAVLDNFCWGDPLRPETLGTLVEACRGCHDAALFYGTPFISGKDSLNNEYLGTDGLRHSIPPTLLISAIGVIEDVTQTITMDLKEAGNFIYLIGEFPEEQKSVPDVAASTRQVYRALHKAIKSGLVRSAHDLSEGGLAVAAAEMCIGGRMGMELVTEKTALIREVNGCMLIEVRPNNAPVFEEKFGKLPFQKIGEVIQQKSLVFRFPGRESVIESVDNLVQAFNNPNHSLVSPLQSSTL
jgi:phosphoribosylformylglycinamidine synthase